MELTLKIPVKPYVKNFLISEYGQEPIVLTLRRPNIILDKLHDLLTRPNRYYRYDMGEDYSETITFVIKTWVLQTVGFEMSEEKVIAFNSFVNQLIKERLFIVIDALRSQNDYEIKEIIQQYLDHNNLLDAGMNYETLKRAYYRYRQNKMKPSTWEIFSQLSVPHTAA